MTWSFREGLPSTTVLRKALCVCLFCLLKWPGSLLPLGGAQRREERLSCPPLFPWRRDTLGAQACEFRQF